ncbi:uncharacterized protein [Euphorbia lathyris]|uniref:uncharacterized protein n=1 Tax=Euphorbia lathyris TaxID=212925 RepID=UPI0033138C14
MMDIWSWICELPDSTESDSPQIFELVNGGGDDSTRGIHVKAQRTAGSTSEALLTLSICLNGFHPHIDGNTIWVSDTCPLKSDKPFLPLLLQLVQEIITRSPMAQTSTCPRSQFQKLKPDAVSWILDTHSPESFSNLFNIVFLMRLFWLCVCDAPSEVGFFYFESLLGPYLEAMKLDQTTVLSTFFIAVGVDAELCFMRTFGYMLTKWLLLTPTYSGHQLRLSYATEANGFWVLKAYAPLLAMELSNNSSRNTNRDSVLNYALAHQQLETVIQLEYSVTFHEGYLRVTARVDNLRFHVSKLGFSKKDEVDYANERHFVSRARIWVGPEVGATYVSGLSLGRSTNNGEREVEQQRVVKGSCEKLKAPKIKTRARMGTRARIKNWRWDQDAEGNCVIFDAVLHDNSNGHEVAMWKRMSDGDEVRNQYNGPRRPFTKTRGLVFAGDEYGEGVEWRLSKEMEGNVLKWRIGGEVWVSYLPNQVKSTFSETRCVEWCDEVDLPLIPGK